MRKYLTFLVMAVFILQSGAVAAAGGTDPVIYFEIEPDLFQKACKEKVWAGVVAKWEGTTDSRDNKAIGLQVKKGGEEIQAYADPALEVTMDAALKDILQECGMALVEKVPADGLRISANIKEFFIDVIKNVVSGHTAAQSLIGFDVYRGKRVESIDVGVEIESKGMRNRKIKAIRKAANKLLAETLKAIPENRHMKEIR